MPYREQHGIDRIAQLEKLLCYLSGYLARAKYDVHIIACKQLGNAKWNAGMVLNSAINMINWKTDQLVMHGVDVFPIDVVYSRHKGASLLTPKRAISTKDYYSSVLSFDTKDFMDVNGFSNDYWGWGYNDTDILRRFLACNKEVTVMLDNQYSEEHTTLRAATECKEDAIRNFEKFRSHWVMATSKPFADDGIKNAPTAVVDSTEKCIGYTLHRASIVIEQA
jgi:hypothetical protein